MATLNRIVNLFTHEGAPAKRIDAIAQLERSVLSCLLWEDEFYESGETIAQRIAELVKQVPASEVARVAVQAKIDMRLRHVPLLLAREMLRSKEGREAFGGVADKVFARPDDMTEFLALYWKDAKDAPLAKQAKRHIGEAFRRFDEYQLAKYNGGQKTVKLRDALRITRPKPKDEAQAELWRIVEFGIAHALPIGGKVIGRPGRRRGEVEFIIGLAAWSRQERLKTCVPPKRVGANWCGQAWQAEARHRSADKIGQGQAAWTGALKLDCNLAHGGAVRIRVRCQPIPHRARIAAVLVGATEKLRSLTWRVRT